MIVILLPAASGVSTRSLREIKRVVSLLFILSGFSETALFVKGVRLVGILRIKLDDVGEFRVDE